jgi:hypothetical protein
MGASCSDFSKVVCLIGGALAVVGCAQQPQRAAPSEETTLRMKIAAVYMQDAVIVDCQLPGSLKKLGGVRTYLSPGKLTRLPAVDCRSLGGEYTLADLSSGTLSLERWMPLAERGDAEAQYYVARIYANGMSGVTPDFQKAAQWYQRAADQNYKAAVMELAYLYEQGLGVAQDKMLALNMQRSASGLGEDLDYASKIATAQADAARQVSELSERLEESNASLEDMRSQLVAMQGSLSRSRAELSHSEDAVLDLREKLVAARRNTGSGGADPARIKQLEGDLASRERALGDSQKRIGDLERDLAAGQSQLAANLANSQASSAQLAQLLAASQAETKSLRSQVAQTEQRLISSQEELRQLRGTYRQDVDRLVAQREELEKLRSKTADGGAALVAAKQRELDRQALRVQSLEAELAAAKAAVANAATSAQSAQASASSNADAAKAAQAKIAAADAKAAAANAQALSLRNTVASIQGRFDEQTRLLQSQRAELDTLRTKGTQPDRTALIQSLTDKLERSTLELQEKQRRLASVESETGTLRTQFKMLQAEVSKSAETHAGDMQRLRAALTMVQQRHTEDANELDRVRTEAAQERFALAQEKETLSRQLSAGLQKSQREVERLNLVIQEREAVIQVREKMIASLQKQLDEPAQSTLVAGNIPMRSASQPVKLDPEASKLLALAQTSERDSNRRYHALVIGNSNYAFMAPLATPVNDARDVAAVLANGYGFDVETLFDATSDQIMTRMYEMSKKLTESDNLLIYFAGHGDKGQSSNSAYWLGTDADKSRTKGWIALDLIRDQIKSMKARHILVVADACFAGAMTHAKTTSVGREVSERRFQLQWNRRARMVLTSGQNTPVTDSGGSRDHSLFATYFIQVLRQNMLLMSGEMLSYELSGRIAPEARKIGVEEQPTYSTLGDANHDFGEFFFVPVATKLAALNPG